MSDSEVVKELQQEALEKEGDSASRELNLFWQKICLGIALIWVVFQVYFSVFGVLDAIRLRVWHILFIITLVFLLYPSYVGKKVGKFKTSTSPSILDFAFIALGYISFGYLLLYFDDIAMRGGWFESRDIIMASIGVIVCFVTAFRVVPSLAWLAFVFFAYIFLGSYVPGAFGHMGFSWSRAVAHMFWGTQGLLGVGVGVSATYIFLFVLFGSFLKYSGFSAFVNDLALALVGRSAGGPAKVSVLASALMGMINGSALANVATTGAITIPLMKKCGYRSEFAGAVEAVASTGGQFAPPIMGAVGFIMAEFLGIPYTTVMLAVSIPAFLYYFSLILAVHFEAKKLGLQGVSKENIPKMLNVLKQRGHLSIPLIVLIGLLFMGYTPLFAAAFSILATVLAAAIKKETRMSFKTIVVAMEEGARGALSVCVACVIIGVIIGTVSLTALGIVFAQEVLAYVGSGEASGFQLYFAAFLVMAMSIVLGMGVPGVAAYVIVAAVAVPVLIRVGVTPMAAHMFCLFYACLSNITPPVAMSSYVAAGIARSDQTKTSIIAVRLGLAGFILPFFFIDNSLLLYSSEHAIISTIWAFTSATAAIFVLTAALEGYCFARLNVVLRIAFALSAFFLLHNNLHTDIIGFVLCVSGLLYNFKTRV